MIKPRRCVAYPLLLLEVSLIYLDVVLDLAAFIVSASYKKQLKCGSLIEWFAAVHCRLHKSGCTALLLVSLGNCINFFFFANVPDLELERHALIHS